MTPTFLPTETVGRTRVIIMHRPEVRNALTRAMRLELKSLFVEADGDDAVDVIVLTGTDPAFSGGVDVKELRALNESGDPRSHENTDPGSTIRAVGKPVIAAVNGACVTGALELALSCDLIIASDRATFADTHAQIGLLPAWGMSALLPRAVGMRKAVELTLTGAFVDAEEARGLGLVNMVVPHAELRLRALEVAERIGGGDPATIRGTLELYRRGDGLSLGAALALESDTWQDWRASKGQP